MDIDWLLADDTDVEQAAAPSEIQQNTQPPPAKSGVASKAAGDTKAENIAEQALAGLENSGFQASTFEESEREHVGTDDSTPAAAKTKRQRWIFSKESLSIAALALIAAGIWAFPTISKMWLERELIASLNSEESPEVKIRSLAGLRSFLPKSLPHYLDQFEQPSLETSQFAYQSLDAYLDQVLTTDTTNNRDTVNLLIDSLDSRSANLHPESRRYAVALASRVLRSAIDRTDSQSQQITLAARRVMSILETPTPQTIAAQSEPQKISDASSTLPEIIGQAAVDTEIPNNLPAGSSNRPSAADSLSDSRSLSDASINANSIEPHATGTTAQLDDITSTAATAPHTVSRSPQRVSAELSDSTNLLIADLPEAPSFSGELIEQELPAPIDLSIGSSTENSAALGDAALGDAALGDAALGDVSKRNGSSTMTAQPGMRESIPIDQPSELRGLDQLQDGEVVRLLTSVQPRYVRAAYADLERRGYSEQQLSLAVNLAQSGSQRRIELMQQLATSPNLNPIPWLVWMAEVGDQPVKLTAVSLLGSFQDDIARLQLRKLSRREKDAQVIDRIKTALIYEPSQPRVANASYRSAEPSNKYR